MSHNRRRNIPRPRPAVFTLLAIAGLLSGSTQGFAQQAPVVQPRSGLPAARPRLVVLVAIDQFRADYLDRFASQFTGGLARIRSGAALFPHGLQDHAITETAPGHATMLSGREPVHTEIVTNARGVPDASSPLVDATGPGASPRRFVGTTLYDWLLARDSTARVLSVSRKDRGAILPVGRARGSVYWFASGRFTTSRYYADTLPTWVRRYDDAIHLERFAGARWDLLLPPSAYAEPDSVPAEHQGADFVFPHRLPTAATIASGIQQYPWMDSLTLDFALRGVRALRLGEPHGHDLAVPDLLSISLSTTDAIGHAYGPQSREIHDHLLRVDRWLGAFLDSLTATVPADRILLVLTADHGVSPLPELEVPRTGHGGRIWPADIALGAERALGSRFHTDFGIQFDNGLIVGDTAALAARGVSVDSLASALAAEARTRAGVRAAYTPRTLAAAAASDSGAVLWRRTLPRTLDWLVCLEAAPGYLWSSGKSTVAEHSTPNSNDLAVPVAFQGPGIEPGRYDEVVRTVDIAPTLAALLGVAPTEPLDGSPIRRLVRARAAHGSASAASHTGMP